MEYESAPKRRRTASPPPLQELDGNIEAQIPPPNAKPPSGEDDTAYQVYLERAFADPRFRSTLAQIFNKYDRNSVQPDEAIDPALSAVPAGGSVLVDPALDAQLGGLVNTGNLPYNLNTEPGGPRDEHGNIVDYQVNRLGETTDPYGPVTAPGYLPGFSGGAEPGLLNGWYGNAFQGPSSYTSPWDGLPGQFPMPHDSSMPAGPWTAPNNLAYDPTPWPSQANQPGLPPASQPTPTLESLPPVQSNALDRPKYEERKFETAQEDESTYNCQTEFELSTDALGRKQRRRIAQPRFSKNGKRLGRPPKGQEAQSAPGDTGVSDGEREDNGGLPDLKNPAGEFGDEDDDTLWGELAEALQLASKATSKRRSRHNTKPPQKGENSATESDGAAEADKEAGQADVMLRKIQQELIDRAVRRSTLVEENGEDTDAGAEGRRRSGRERKAVNFGEQVPWDKVSAERKAGHKIKMHLRALSVQVRREKKKREKEEAEKAAKEKAEAEKEAKEKEEAEKAEREKREADQLAAAAANKSTAEESSETMPSTIPDSQDTVTSLPIRTTPKKPQSKQIMRQTIKNHVNSVVHFEEDDEGLSDDEAPAAFSIKTPTFSYQKAPKPVHNFLGENYIDTVYALSDDEAPALLDSLQRVSIGKKKNPSLVPIAVALPTDTVSASKRNITKKASQKPDTETMEGHAGKESISGDLDEADAASDPSMDIDEPVNAPPKTSLEQSKITRLSGGGDGNDSGIDIPSEQASSEQAERPRVRRASIPTEPLFQDPDLLGAADLLDSLDVMSETEDIPSSPTIGYDMAEEDTQMNDLPAISTKGAPFAPKDEHPVFADDEPILRSMDLLEDIGGDMPFLDEETDTEDGKATEPLLKTSAQSAASQKPIGQNSRAPLPAEKHQFTNISFVQERPDEIDSDPIEDARLPSPQNTSSPPPLRRPLPQQAKSARNEIRKPVAASSSRGSTPKAISKEPSPASTGEQSRARSTSSSRAPAPASRSGTAKKVSSSSRRSLLSLISGGEDDIETLIKKKPTSQTPKAAPATTAKPLPSKPPSSTSRSSSSHRKSKPSSSSSSSTRLSLGSLSSLARDRSKSSKGRHDAKERRRKSASAVSTTDATAGKKGTCGVDGYTCGRDFCFTCL